MSARPPLVVGADGRPEALQAGDTAGQLAAGPASAVDEALARYDGTTGKLLQSSPVNLGDAGNLDWQSSGGAIGCGINDNDTLSFQAVDTGAHSFIDFAQLKSGATPQFRIRNNTEFVDMTDPTKSLKLDCSGVTTGTVRTLTVPNKNGTIATTADGGSTSALFDHFADAGNIGSGDDDLYSDTIAANTLTTNGDKLHAEYSGVFNVSGCTLKAVFAGTNVFNSGSVSTSGTPAWHLDVVLIRSSSNTARVIVNFTAQGVNLQVTYTALTSQDFASTNILKITGAGGLIPADNDIVAKFAYVEKLLHA